MRTGPKPIEIEDLRVEANEWACVLYCLRDGKAGMIQKLKWGPWRTVPAVNPSQKILELMKGTPWEGVSPSKPKKQLQSTGTTLVARIIPANAQGLRMVTNALKPNKGWEYTAPISPSPRLWERLKMARTVAEMQRAIRATQEYLFRNWSVWPGRPFPRELVRHAAALLKAKQLFNYPKSKRKGSDDKRVVFIAKVLAGLELGRSPLYTIKRLSHWRPRKDLATNPYKTFVAGFSRKGVPK